MLRTIREHQREFVLGTGAVAVGMVLAGEQLTPLDSRLDPSATLYHQRGAEPKGVFLPLSSGDNAPREKSSSDRARIFDCNPLTSVEINRIHSEVVSGSPYHLVLKPAVLRADRSRPSLPPLSPHPVQWPEVNAPLFREITDLNALLTLPPVQDFYPARLLDLHSTMPLFLSPLTPKHVQLHLSTLPKSRTDDPVPVFGVVEGIFDGTVRARGNSRHIFQEAPQFEVDIDPAVTNSFFRGVRSFDLITTGTLGYSDIRDEANVRVVGEAVSYTICAILNDLAIPTRLIYLESFQGSSHTPLAAGFATVRLSKHALEKQVMLPKEPKVGGLATRVIWLPDWESQLRVSMIEVLLENWDFEFARLKNMLGFTTEFGTTKFVPIDFDLSGFARGYNGPSQPAIEVMLEAIMGTALLSTQYEPLSRADREDRLLRMGEICREFMGSRQRCERAIAVAPLPPERRESMLHRIDSFYGALSQVVGHLDSVEQFDRAISNGGWFERRQGIRNSNELRNSWCAERFIAPFALRSARSAEQFVDRLIECSAFTESFLVEWGLALPYFATLEPDPYQVKRVSSMLRNSRVRGGGFSYAAILPADICARFSLP